MDYNKVILVGRLTRDPETRNTPSGKVITGASLALNRSWKGEDGQKKEEVSFVDTTSFGRTAEFISKYFRKGESILVEGRLRQDTWEDKTTGQKRSKIVVVVDNARFAGGKASAEEAGAGRPAVPEDPERAYVPPVPEAEPELPDSIPF